MTERPERGHAPADGSPERGRPGYVHDLDRIPGGSAGELERTIDRIAGRGTEPDRAGRSDRSDRPARSGGAADDLRQRIATDPDTVERDLVKLVLTVVELVRQLMERQALRRIDQGDLSEDQEERIGMTLMLLEERMAELRDRYGLSAADLNLDLGPLGSLLPTPDEEP